MTRARGRPPRENAPASRDQILTTALELLDANGVEAFTMRALARRLEVNPMTIYHYFGNRDGLIDAMFDYVYDDVSALASGDFHDRMKSVLQSYHDRVLDHPSLALLVFMQPAMFPRQAQRITDDIDRILAEAGLSPERCRLWLNIIVDFTHGAAIAAALGVPSSSAVEDAKNEYSNTLAELLRGISD